MLVRVVLARRNVQARIDILNREFGDADTIVAANIR